MKELSITELMTIDGGSEETRAAGRAAGAKARDAFDDASTFMEILGIVWVIVTKSPKPF